MKLKALTAALSAAAITVSAGAFTAFADSGDVKINGTNFPDDVFRQYVSENCDKNGDGVLSESEAGEVTYINVSREENSPQKISNLKGIEYFTGLTRLSCFNNQLTNLDVSSNTALTELYCYKNQLASLDVGSNIALTELWCYDNPIKKLDVCSNTALTTLICYNNQLTKLDVSKNTALKELMCRENNISSLDVSSNTALTELDCSQNPIKSLDVSSNTALTKLYCNDNQLTKLDVSKNTALVIFWCGENQLTDLDVSNSTVLRELYCYSNQLTSLDVSQNTALTYLNCSNNQLTSLDVSQNTALTYLSCGRDQLTSLDVSKNTALTELWCNFNQFTSLDVSKNPALTKLSCSNNQLTNLDLSRNTVLKALWCSANQLTNLDLSKNTALTDVNCSSNQLTSLDLSKNIALLYFSCSDNQLENIDASSNTELICLICNDNKLTSLNVSKNPTLTGLYCQNNKLTSLDVSKNTGLADLQCYNNNLTSLNLSANKSLSDLNSSDNTYFIGEVTTYDLANLPAGFDISKASDWQGATLDGSVLTNFTSDKITYTYDCGNGRSETFTLTTTEKADDTDPDSTSEPVSAFVNRLYTIILDRPAEEAGLADWTSSLKSGESTSADIVYGLANSDEFKNKGLSNDEVIERMYMAMLGRASDEGGKADWLDAMANGCTVNGIINGFSGSQEFANVCAGYGISAGSVTSCEPRDKNVNLTSFVSRMYTKALNRAYDVSGLNDWTGDYLDGKKSANDIAYGFILSQEFESRNLTNEQYVDTLYRTFFDREPDEGGKAGWLDELAKGTSRKDVLDGFLGAQEFANLKKSFGV